MKQLKTTFEEFNFEEGKNLPQIDLVFSACRVNSDKHAFDIVDFNERTISRWSIPHMNTQNYVKELRNKVNAKWPLSDTEFEQFWSVAMQTHVVQCSPVQNKLLVCFGPTKCGFCFLIIDTKTNQTRIFPENFDTEPMLYMSTGDFTTDNNHWLFIRWPLDDTLNILSGKAKTARCEIVRLNLATLKSEIVYKLDNIDNIHQITCSQDGRYIVFTPFNAVPKVSYPDAFIDEDPDGYRKTHEAGLHKAEMVTVDLQANCHWRTIIPVPMPSHFEFDLFDQNVFYVSAHNFCLSSKNQIVLEGSAAIFKMRISDGKTVIEGKYSDDEFFRITQHMPFRFQNRTLIAVTNLPNKLDILDGEDMSLWHREQIFPAPPLDLSKTGNLVCPMFPKSCYSINPSKDGNYIVLESAIGLILFDVEKREFMDITISRRLPDGLGGLGHTRLIGH